MSSLLLGSVTNQRPRNKNICEQDPGLMEIMEITEKKIT